MTSLAEYLESVQGFSRLPQTQQLLVLGSYFELCRGASRFVAGNLLTLYREARQPAPANPHTVLARLLKQKLLLRDKGGYFLSTDGLYQAQRLLGEAVKPPQDSAKSPVIDHMDGLLATLPAGEAHEYLEEAVKCFRATCFRAAIVMGWSLCYHQLVNKVLSGHVVPFNQALSATRSKLGDRQTYDDFLEMKESEVIHLCRTAKITTRPVTHVLERCLATRNDYAHPSRLAISRATAESFLEQVVTNVIAKL